jgi:hypothetical protein
MLLSDSDLEIENFVYIPLMNNRDYENRYFVNGSQQVYMVVESSGSSVSNRRILSFFINRVASERADVTALCTMPERGLENKSDLWKIPPNCINSIAHFVSKNFDSRA